MHLPQLRQQGVTLSVKLTKNNFLKTNFPRWPPMRCEILWQKLPRVRKVSSVPNQQDTTMCSLINRKTQTCEVCHEPGGRIKPKKRGQDSFFYKIWRLDHGRSQQGVEARTQKRCNRARLLHGLDSEFSDGNERNIGDNVCRVHKDFSSFTHTQLKKPCQYLPWNHNTSTLLRSETSGRTNRSQSATRNNYRTSAKWSTRRVVGLCGGMPPLLAQRARQNGRFQDSSRETMW